MPEGGERCTEWCDVGPSRPQEHTSIAAAIATTTGAAASHFLLFDSPLDLNLQPICMMVSIHSLKPHIAGLHVRCCHHGQQEHPDVSVLVRLSKARTCWQS